MSVVRIALANIRPARTRGESVVLARKAITQAAAAGAVIVCFPECYIPGYRTAGSTLPPPEPSFLEEAWAHIAGAAEAGSIAVILGTERVVDGATRITAMVFNPDGSDAGFQDK